MKLFALVQHSIMGTSNILPCREDTYRGNYSGESASRHRGKLIACSRLLLRFAHNDVALDTTRRELTVGERGAVNVLGRGLTD